MEEFEIIYLGLITASVIGTWIWFKRSVSDMIKNNKEIDELEIPYEPEEQVTGLTLLHSRASYLKAFRNVVSIHNSVILYGANGSGKSHFIHNYLKDYANEENPIIHIKAWEYDRQDEPLTMLLNKLIYKNILTDKSKEKLVDFLKLKDRYSTVRRIKHNGMTYVDYLKGLMSRLDFKVQSFEIIIDEIDRTKPEYSIEIMEMLNIYIPRIKNVSIKTIYVSDKSIFQKMLMNTFNIDGSDIERFIHKYAEIHFVIPEIKISEFEELITSDYKVFSFSNLDTSKDVVAPRNNLRKMKFEFKTFNELGKSKNYIHDYMKTIIIYGYIAKYNKKILIGNNITDSFQRDVEKKFKEYFETNKSKILYKSGPANYLRNTQVSLFGEYNDELELKDSLKEMHTLLSSSVSSPLDRDECQLARSFSGQLREKMSHDIARFHCTLKIPEKMNHIEVFEKTHSWESNEWVLLCGTINSIIDDYNSTVDKMIEEDLSRYTK